MKILNRSPMETSKWFARREVPLPTWRTCLVGLLLLVSGACVGTRALYPFLAVNDRLDPGAGRTDFLCVEGWAHDGVIDTAVAAFDAGKAESIAVTGGPVQSRERLLGFDSYAELGAHRLIERGVPRERIVVSIPGKAERRRTLHDIVELRRTLEVAGYDPGRVMVFSGDVHARRTRLLYRRVFGSAVEVRACAVAPEGYDPVQWWTTSEGLKTVVMEAISWGYEILAPTGPIVGKS